MKSSREENKRPATSNSTTDPDLDDFVTTPGQCKKAHFAEPLNKKQMFDLEKGPVVLNTEKSTVWALRTELYSVTLAHSPDLILKYIIQSIFIAFRNHHIF